MKKILVVLLFSLILTGCNFKQVKESVEVKLKSTLADTVSNEFGIPKEVVMKYADSLSLDDIKNLISALNNEDYAAVEQIIADSGLGDIDGLADVITEENITETVDFLNEVKTTVEEIDLNKIYEDNSEIISKFKELGVDIESLDLQTSLYKYLPKEKSLLEDKDVLIDSMLNAAVDSYIKEYREKNLISDEEANKLAEKYKETLKSNITSE